MPTLPTLGRKAALLTALACGSTALLAPAGPAAASSSPGTDIAVWAGDGNYAPITPGPALASPMYYPRLLATDRAGTVYVAFDSYSDQGLAVAKITRAGVVGYLTNSARDSGQPVAGPALASPFREVNGLAATPDGTVYISDASSHVVVKVTPGGTLRLVAGNGSGGTITPGPATSSPMNPGALAVAPDGTLYIADTYTPVVYKISTSGVLSIVAGDGSSGTPVTGGPATASPFGALPGLALDSSGDLFIADQVAHCVVMLDAGTGDLETVSGTCGSSGTQIPGAAASSPQNGPTGLAVDPDDDLLVVDANNDVVEKITDPDSGTGVLAVVAGNGSSGNVTPGPATATPVAMTAVAVSRAHDLYLTNSGNEYVYKIAATPGPSDAPLGLAATGGNAKATLSFLPPDDDGNTTLLRYEYSVNGGGWQTLTTTASGMRRIGVVTGLTNGTPYSFRVRAVTSHSNGPQSSNASATPAAPPSAGWFRDVVPSSARAKEVAVPKDPTRYRGPRTYTKARNRAHAGQLAMPVPAIKGRALAAGQAAVLSGDGLFDFNSSRLTAEGRRQVRLLAPALRDAGAIVCEGYTDYGAELSWEYRLSRARAVRVCGALRSLGVDARIASKGYGPQRPVIVGGPRDKRAANRRVIVLVTR